MKEKELLQLLARLKNTAPKYPPQLLSRRRSAFLAGIAALKRGGGPGSRGGGHGGSGHGGMTQMDKLVIAFEVVILVSLSSYLAATVYAQRDSLMQLISPATRSIVHSAAPLFAASDSPTVSATLAATGTPTPTAQTSQAAGGSTAGGTNGGVEPGGQAGVPQPTKPGLHLGQTKNAPPQGSNHSKPTPNP